jgi:hypothetical protein
LVSVEKEMKGTVEDLLVLAEAVGILRKDVELDIRRLPTTEDLAPKRLEKVVEVEGSTRRKAAGDLDLDLHGINEGMRGMDEGRQGRGRSHHGKRGIIEIVGEIEGEQVLPNIGIMIGDKINEL